MADCECLPGCPFFHGQMASMPAMSEMLRAQYCEGDRADNTRCARHMVFAVRGRDAVPTDLYPSESARAEAILAV